jgi:flavin reductase (DIM6/NTAB) family NADH-FMN oxidoreductase RutF
MSMMRRCRKAIARIVFGDAYLPQAFSIGLPDPQTEVAVWLCGMDEPIDVTDRHSMACADPFTVCIGFDDGEAPDKSSTPQLSLRFCEPNGRKQVLAEIGLDVESATVIPSADTKLVLFRARHSKNYCLPRRHLFAHYCRYRYSLWRKPDVPGRMMSFLERRAAMVMFICPHPVVLLSLCNEGGGNIFPMNIMGNLGGGYFALALKESRLAAHLVERAGRVAISNVPLSHTSTAFKLGVNHRKQSISWNELPFQTRLSSTFSIPVPAFAHRVREMEIDTVHRLGSHLFFVARVVSDESSPEPEGLCIVHGFYQGWRLRGRRAELEASLVADQLNRRGVPRDTLPL